jgi:hypothetical protein
MQPLMETSSAFKSLGKGSVTDAFVGIPIYEQPLRSGSTLDNDEGVTVAELEPSSAFETSGQQQVIRPDMAVPVVDRLVPVDVGALTAVLQIWEGVVVDLTELSMSVRLRDRQGRVPEHTANIDLSWVVAQDADLVKPGAVFYWTLYKETKKSTIRHTQEIRFRRLPDWTKKQVASVYSEADALLAKFSQSTIAD